MRLKSLPFGIFASAPAPAGRRLAIFFSGLYLAFSWSCVRRLASGATSALDAVATTAIAGLCFASRLLSWPVGLCVLRFPFRVLLFLRNLGGTRETRGTSFPQPPCTSPEFATLYPGDPDVVHYPTMSQHSLPPYIPQLSAHATADFAVVSAVVQRPVCAR